MKLDKIPGVYAIRNLKNNRLYIGSTVNLKSRKAQHFSHLRNDKHSNGFLQNDWNISGGEKWFVFEILEFATFENVRNIEQIYINQHFDNSQNCYNLRKDATVHTANFSNTPEITRKKHSENMKRRWKCEKFRKKISASISKAKVEKVKDPEYCKSLSVALKKAWSKPEYKSFRDKIADERSKHFELISPDGEIHQGKNIRRFCKENNLGYPSICSVLTGRIKHYKGWQRHVCFTLNT